MATDKNQQQSLRAIGKQLGIVGAEPISSFEFRSKVGEPGLRNEEVMAGTPSFLDRNISLNDEELTRQIASRLRTSGPATFRNLQDVIGTSGIKELQEQFALPNVPSSVLSQQQKLTPGKTIAFTGPEGNTLSGVRKSLEQSLKPETARESTRRKAIGKSRQSALQDEIDIQVEEDIAASNAAKQAPAEPSVIDKLMGVGSSFLDNLFSDKESKPTPTSSVTIPETGEEVNFESDIDTQIAQLEAEAQAAIQAKADPNVVNRRLQDMITQLRNSAGRKTR